MDSRSETKGVNGRVDIHAVQGAYLRAREVHHDNRGLFTEMDRATDWPAPDHFKQWNMSFSFASVLRGMHTMSQDPQGKLITCLFGSIWDVIFDLRFGSPTIGKGYAVQLDWDRGESLFVPPGVAHGFLVLSRHAVVHYNCTTYYDPKFDGGVRWDSPELRDFWPTALDPIISIKDARLPTIEEYLKQRG